jgi:hypothetical protein
LEADSGRVVAMKQSVKKSWKIVLTGVFVLVVTYGVWMLFTPHSFWETHSDETFDALVHDKAHWQFELFVGAVESLVVDVVIIALIWGQFIKPHIHRDISSQDKHMHDTIEELQDTVGRLQGRIEELEEAEKWEGVGE